MSIICLETSHFSFRSSGSDQQYDLIPFEIVAGHQSLRSGNTHSSFRFLYTDASHFGRGAYLESMRLSFHGRCSEDQSQLHINIMEIMAIRFALKKAIIYIHHSCVMISADNTTVVSYINKRGRTRSPNLCVEVLEILHWCLEHDVVIRVRHIPGKLNILADRLLGMDKPLKIDWALDQSVANTIF